MRDFRPPKLEQPTPGLGCKAHSYGLWKSGVFGNRLRVWGSVEEVCTSGFRGSVSIRHKRVLSHPLTNLGRVGVKHLPHLWRGWIDYGENPEDLMVVEGPDESKLLIQGEVMRDTKYLALVADSTAGLTCRQAMAVGRSYFGLQSLGRLQAHMDIRSYEWMWHLLDCYPRAVVEFSTYSYRLGCADMNTIIWEVREY